MDTRIIGIDFGTSTTVVRIHNVGAGNPIVPLTINGMRTIPTIAFCASDSMDMYYGYDAQAKYDSNVKGTLYKNFKMNLISDDEQKRNEAEQLIKGFLQYVYSKYQELLNQGGIFAPADEVKVYVSHPAKWNSYARSLMKECVESAGFCSKGNVILKDEPTAAILAVIHEKNNELKQAGMLFAGREYKAMMIDMGAGTTDIVLFTYKVSNNKLVIEDIFTYPSISNPAHCGGREIDDAIISEVETFVNAMQSKPTKTGDMAINKLRRRVKGWKEKVISPVLRDNIILPEPDEITSYRDTISEFGCNVLNNTERFSISREFFERITEKHWHQWGNLIKGAFDEVAGTQYNQLKCPKTPSEVDLLITTGGHSQWYIVPEFFLGKKDYANLSEKLNFTKIQQNPEALVKSQDPQETVAVGLCHLDEDVVGALASANDISISFNCEGTYLGNCELIKKGVPLPFEKNYEVKGKIDGNFIIRRQLKIEYTVFTDENNQIKKSIIVPSDNSLFSKIIRSVLSVIGVAFIDIPRILYHFITGTLDELDDTIIEGIIDNPYDVKLLPNISVNDEGIITISGSIVVDDDASINIPKTKI